MNRILITGGSGFIGTNLVAHCSAAGYEVLNVDMRPPRLAAAPGSFIEADVLDRARMIALMRDFNPHYLVHLGARTDLDGTTDGDYRANIEGVENVVTAARSASELRRAVFASSMYVCRMGYIPKSDNDYCPHTAYGRSKQLGEDIVRRQAADHFYWTLVRPTSIWGPWFGVPYRTFFDVVRS